MLDHKEYRMHCMASTMNGQEVDDSLELVKQSSSSFPVRYSASRSASISVCDQLDGPLLMVDGRHGLMGQHQQQQRRRCSTMIVEQHHHQDRRRLSHSLYLVDFGCHDDGDSAGEGSQHSPSDSAEEEEDDDEDDVVEEDDEFNGNESDNEEEEEEDGEQVEMAVTSGFGKTTLDDGVHFFEGAEKRLMVYLVRVGQADLRTIHRSSWEYILDKVNCQILNVVSNDHFVAYLLSESSMFVWRDAVMIKTCGSTTLLHCLEPLLETVKEAGFDCVEDVFYSHKNMLLPALQVFPHNSFQQEEGYLNGMFQGSSFTFGHNKECGNNDVWHLYSLDGKQDGSEEQASIVPDPLLPLPLHQLNDAWKFELVMERLCPQVMAQFFTSSYPSGSKVTARDVTRLVGIDTLVPGMVIDDFLFQPCGYSMNGLLGKYYMTIHITPEEDFSYVSLETNVPMATAGYGGGYLAFMRKALKMFKPGKFMVNLIEPNQSSSSSNDEEQLQEQQQQQPKPVHKSLTPTSLYHQLNKEEKLVVNDDDGGEQGSAKTKGLNGSASAGGSVGEGGGIWTKYGRYHRADLQQVSTKQADIVFARYVVEGIS